MLFWDSTKRYLAIGLLAAITIALCVAAFTKGRLWAVPVVTAAQAGAGSVNQPPAEPPIAAPPASSATSTAAPEPEVAVFLGDGFIQGIGGEGVTVVAAVALATDWRAVNLGLSGTGWSHATKTGGVDVCGREICPAIPEMVDEALSQHPTMIVISAGYNDRESIETVVVNTVQRI